MEIDWRKVAVSLNTESVANFDVALKSTNPELVKEFQFRGWILQVFAMALFSGLPEEPS
jgi:hypothetical protein